jgi:hypothetical protein
MGLLWSSWRAPATDADVEALVGTWQQFFASVPAAQVTRAIYELSAEGTEFAPQVGQIYAKVKANRPAAVFARPDVQKLDAWYRDHCERFAAAGVPTAVEAKRMGISDAEWCRRAEAAGL